MATLSLHCCAWALSSSPCCSGFSSCRARALGPVGFSSCGVWAQLPWGMWNSPDQGSNPYPLHWQVDSQPPGHQGSLGPLDSCENWSFWLSWLLIRGDTPGKHRSYHGCCGLPGFLPPKPTLSRASPPRHEAVILQLKRRAHL